MPERVSKVELVIDDNAAKKAVDDLLRKLKQMQELAEGIVIGGAGVGGRGDGRGAGVGGRGGGGGDQGERAMARAMQRVIGQQLVGTMASFGAASPALAAQMGAGMMNMVGTMMSRVSRALGNVFGPLGGAFGLAGAGLQQRYQAGMLKGQLEQPLEVLRQVGLTGGMTEAIAPDPAKAARLELEQRLRAIRTGVPASIAERNRIGRIRTGAPARPMSAGEAAQAVLTAGAGMGFMPQQAAQMGRQFAGAVGMRVPLGDLTRIFANVLRGQDPATMAGYFRGRLAQRAGFGVLQEGPSFEMFQRLAAQGGLVGGGVDRAIRRLTATMDAAVQGGFQVNEDAWIRMIGRLQRTSPAQFGGAQAWQVLSQAGTPGQAALAEIRQQLGGGLLEKAMMARAFQGAKTTSEAMKNLERIAGDVEEQRQAALQFLGPELAARGLVARGGVREAQAERYYRGLPGAEEPAELPGVRPGPISAKLAQEQLAEIGRVTNKQMIQAIDTIFAIKGILFGMAATLKDVERWLNKATKKLDKWF